LVAATTLYSMNQQSNQLVYHFDSSLDTDFLNKNYGSNLNLASKIFAAFMHSAYADIEKLKLVVDSNDFTEMLKISHRIKNNYLYVGLSHVTELFKVFEQQIEDKSEEARLTFQEIYQLCNKSITTVEKELADIKQFLAN